jgi:hypothetical protein
VHSWKYWCDAAGLAVELGPELEAVPDRIPRPVHVVLGGLVGHRQADQAAVADLVVDDDEDPGHRFEPSGEGRSYHLTGSALSEQPLGRIEIVVNGEVARTLEPANRRTERGAHESPIDAEVPVEGTSWLAVRVFEDRPEGRVRFAHAAPWYIDVPGRPLRPRRAEVEYLIRRVEEQITRSAGVLPEPALAEYRAALQRYRAIAETAR